MNYLEGLNDKQREAVLHTEGRLLVLAGAGSGKTKLVTHKIAYLIKERKIMPWNILAITFTNKAANEMKERVAKLIDVDVDGMWMGTFHSICVRILRRHIDRLGYESSFTIYDMADQKTLVKECIKDMNLDDKTYQEAAVRGGISRLKNDMISPDQYINENYSNLYKRNIGELYALYQKKLKEYNALDFDDLLIKTVELLRDHRDVAERYREQFNYIFVDEYQDTNNVQAELIKLLLGEDNNITLVGDTDQSIYGWRGANIDNIRNFEKEFAPSTVILLEQNYRSSSNILDLANQVIKNNKGRHEKNLWTDNQEGSLPKYKALADEREEANYIVEELGKLGEENFQLSDVAILYRTNAQSRSFEEAFMKNSIPYKLVGGLKFYDRAEIKDLVAYLRVLSNNPDNISLKRIINTPKRGIGKVTVDKLEEFSNKLGISMFEGLNNLNLLEIAPSTRTKLEGFRDMILDLEGLKDTMALDEFIERLIADTGYIEDLKKQNTIEAETKIENIREFLSSAVDFQVDTGGNVLEEFLASLALLSDVDKTEETDQAVTMLTVHSAKGLEFPVVFMVGMEDGLFPSSRSFDEEEEMEEERRLCYVAITRAEKKLYVTNAKIRTMYGRVNYTQPSRYISEMGDLIDREIDVSIMEEYRIKDQREGERKKANRRKHDSFTSSLFKEKEQKPRLDNRDLDIAVGDKVEHKKWGIGTVVQVKDKGNGDSELVIAFDKELKRLLKSIAPLKILR